MNIFANVVAVASALSCLFFCLRLHALSASKVGKAAMPKASRVWLLLMAAATGFHAQVVLFTQNATWTEVVLAVVVAGYSFHMWLNVRQRVVVPMRQGLPIRS